MSEGDTKGLESIAVFMMCAINNLQGRILRLSWSLTCLDDSRLVNRFDDGLNVVCSRSTFYAQGLSNLAGNSM
jgi:hypothetical protein